MKKRIVENKGCCKNEGGKTILKRTNDLDRDIVSLQVERLNQARHNLVTYICLIEKSINVEAAQKGILKSLKIMEEVETIGKDLF